MGWEVIAQKGIEIAIKAGLFEKIKAFFKSKKKIVIFGSSGVGKTQFVKSFKTKQGISVSRSNRTKTVEKSFLSFDKIPVLLIDTPGDDLRRSFRDEEVRKIIKNDCAGIINVVAYGYHEGPVSQIEQVMDGENVKDSYLSARKQKELEQLVTWLPFVELSNLKWIITLVNKADIWWDKDLSEIENYYENGEYGKFINKMNKPLNHIVLPYCSTIEPFYGIKTSGRFGMTSKINLQTHFQSTLLNSLGKIGKIE